MADRYLLESGAPDGYLLEDGTGVLLLDAPPVALDGTSTGTSTTTGSLDVQHPLAGSSAGTSRSGLHPGLVVPHGSVYPGVVELSVEIVEVLEGSSVGASTTSGDLTVDLAAVSLPMLVMSPRVAV